MTDWVIVKYDNCFTHAARVTEPGGSIGSVIEVRRTRIDSGVQKATMFDLGREKAAREWLCDMGLHRRLARRLLDAAIRNVGPLADPKHQRRVAV